MRSPKSERAQRFPARGDGSMTTREIVIAVAAGALWTVA